ncbi:DNA translocase FtsK 4TM domain-containing protein [Pseudomonas sp.]|uniref:FtsK/SpoIIIE family DNA translocase n=1 Tax=Pseudomonas sp. TaxID=306 RepID=UPI00273163F7|nr:DNA translocase FtsK 4TM domain-containing protein [Pseudomonas sp.]MDP2245161.1 DNA translocase FtsK 4TM domain-containing protein [Pseudomonas sp.]
MAMELAAWAWTQPFSARLRGGVVAAAGLALIAAFATWNSADPSLNVASALPATNILRGPGAVVADIFVQSLGLAAWGLALLMVVFGLTRAVDPDPDAHRGMTRIRALVGAGAVLALAGAIAAPSPPKTWALARGLGGFWGDGLLGALSGIIAFARIPGAELIAALVLLAVGGFAATWALGVSRAGMARAAEGALETLLARRPAPRASEPAAPVRAAAPRRAAKAATTPKPLRFADDAPAEIAEDEADIPAPGRAGAPAIKPPKPAPKNSSREVREQQKTFDFVAPGGFMLPELAMLAKPKPRVGGFDEEALRQNARLLESVLSEFGIRGAIDQIRPGPVVTLYELVPAPGVKHARVVALADDISRSMGVAACRVSVVSGRNAIALELPNARRETVYLRDLLASADYEKASQTLPMALGETIGGEPYIADLARMPHLLIAGTTGSGKSVGVNAMILSILYRLSPEQCRFIMIDPKMLELSVYDGIPHLLAPVVTDSKKAIVALKWTVREMEDRYRRMAKIGVRGIAAYNERAKEALDKGEHFERTVQTGFDEAGRPIFESEKIRPEHMPYLVVVIDEVADLMMVAGKDIEGAVQRLAQMARAAGIHLIMATQRPSVDVITGTIKANFPTRISFQVTSRIDSRTILGEQGAEQLLGQGDMLYMAGGSGGRLTRLHGPFVADEEVAAVAKFLREQGAPQYLDEVTAGGDDEDGDGGGHSSGGGDGDENSLYDRAVAVVTRDGKASTSYIQRRLQIGYNRAASLIERMEQEGVVGPANHAGKREILAPPPP